MGMPSSSATARTSSGATMLALSGPLEKTITTLRPGTFAASRSVSSSALYSAVSSPATALRRPVMASDRSRVSAAARDRLRLKV